MSENWKTREQMEEAERAMLAPFAQKSGDSRGRQHSEPSHSYRTEFQRDRARIIHSRAFRRMEYKTQVFLNGTGDHLRTRLTHSIEVASISRTIARALGLNEDLAEAIALAHDLGHSPFGHSGEEMLAECMRDHGVLTRYGSARGAELHKLIIRDIIDNEVNDLVTASAKAIAESEVQTADDVRRQRAPLIRYSDELAGANRALRKFLYQNVYYHPRVAEVNRRACEMLRCVFEAYLVDPDRLGDGATRLIENQELHRTVCDYVAGMTDRYLMEEYERIAG